MNLSYGNKLLHPQGVAERMPNVPAPDTASRRVNGGWLQPAVRAADKVRYASTLAERSEV
ncbi:MAG: hypothetical protein LBH44_12155 [Treponema sp.]|jgi:hypothetical protein|nr:hypothetical protein [Treponema sp.]